MSATDMRSSRRIVAVNAKQVGRILAVVYGSLGIISTIIIAVSGSQRMAFPLGFFAAPFHLAINFNFGLPDNPIGRVLLFLTMILCCALTGWISGVVLTALFNLVAKRIGGIDASFVESEEPTPSKPSEEPATPEIS